MRKIVQVVFLGGLLLPVGAASDSNQLRNIPDFTQTDVRSATSGNGQSHCAPVAVSNSFMWLDRTEQDQHSLIEKLASTDYMNTSLKHGTSTAGLMRGVDKLANEQFGGYAELAYQGWRAPTGLYSQGEDVPQLDWIVSGIADRSAVWINVGWYRYDPAKDVYRRMGGHWVTLVDANERQFVLNDPALRAGQHFSNEYVSISIIDSGILMGKRPGLSVSAKGRIRLGAGMHIKSPADTAIVDGVVKLVL